MAGDSRGMVNARVAINAAIGLSIAFAGVFGSVADFASLRLRTAVLWIPLLLAYWTTIGLRAAFFVPSELPAAWTFRASAPQLTGAYWLALRASISLVVPPSLALIALMVAPPAGWQMTMWCVLVTGAR